MATIYDINSAYSAGYTGADQSIAIVGQSSIVLSDIEKFQSAAGLSTKDPTLVLVPNSGSATVHSDDEAESDLDLEYSGGIATGATIYFVYVGNNPNYSVWDSLNYAVDNKTAPIISVTYGACETALSSNDYSTLNGILEQAATQGQSVIAAAGDNGSDRLLWGNRFEHSAAGDTSRRLSRQQSVCHRHGWNRIPLGRCLLFEHHVLGVRQRQRRHQLGSLLYS